MKKKISVLLSCLLTANVFSNDTIPVKEYYELNFVFASGYWVYRDTVNNDIDSISLVNCMHDYVDPNPLWNDYQEYYLMQCHSHSYDYSYNDYIFVETWKRNGGGDYGELGQPIMYIEQYAQYPEVGSGFNGFEIIDIITNSIEIQGNVFNNVVVSRIYEDDQYQYEFEYTTDLYFGPKVGIIRKEYTDDLGVKHVWDLVNWQSIPYIYTGIEQITPNDDNMILYPNPANRQVILKSQGMKSIELIDLQGKSILKTKCNCDEFVVNLENSLNGIYFIRVITNKGVIVKKVVIQ